MSLAALDREEESEEAMTSNIVLEFPSSYEWLNLVDLVCCELTCETGNFSKDDLNDISISVIEACTNALEHGNRSNPELNVRVVFRRHPDHLEVEVSDFGEGFDFEDYLRHIPDPSDIEHQRGRGIFIMKEMMDSLEFEKLPERGMKVILRKMTNGSGKTKDRSLK